MRAVAPSLALAAALTSPRNCRNHLGHTSSKDSGATCHVWQPVKATSREQCGLLHIMQRRQQHIPQQKSCNNNNNNNDNAHNAQRCRVRRLLYANSAHCTRDHHVRETLAKPDQDQTIFLRRSWSSFLDPYPNSIHIRSQANEETAPESVLTGPKRPRCERGLYTRSHRVGTHGAVCIGVWRRA